MASISHQVPLGQQGRLASSKAAKTSLIFVNLVSPLTSDALQINILKVKGDGHNHQRITVGDVFAGNLPTLNHRGNDTGQLIYKAYLKVCVGPYTKFSRTLVSVTDMNALYRYINPKPLTELEQSIRRLYRSSKASVEIGALRHVNKLGCQYVPTLLGVFRHIVPSSSWVAREEFMVMTKVPGVANRGKFHCMPLREQIQMKKAFVVALQAIHDCGVDNGSHHLGNVLWCREEGKW